MRMTLVISIETDIVSVLSGIYQAPLSTWTGDYMREQLPSSSLSSSMGGQAVRKNVKTKDNEP